MTNTLGNSTSKTLIELCDSWWPEAEKLQALLEKDSVNISAEVKGQALYLAIDKRNIKYIRILLNHCGKDISEEDKRKALQSAVERQQLRLIYVLLTHPAFAFVFTQKPDENLPLLIAFCTLIEENASVKDPRETSYFSLISKKIVDIPSLAFYLAVKHNNLDILPDIFKRDTLPREIMGAGLICAAKNHNSAELINAILIFTEDALRDSDKFEAMKNAVSNKRDDAAYALVTNHRVLETISRMLFPDEAIYLLKMLGAYFENKQALGLFEDAESYQARIKQILMVPSLAFYGAILNNDVQLLTQILSKYESEIKKDFIQEGFLLAAKKGQLEIVGFMRSHFEEILKDHMLRALEVAAESGQVKIVNVLLSDASLFSTLAGLLQYDDIEKTQKLLSLVEKEASQYTLKVAEYQPVTDKTKQIPALVFLHALKNNQPQVVLGLLNSYTIPEYIKERAFLLAAENNLFSCLAILLNQGQLKGFAHQSRALEIASKKGYLEIVRLLLENSFLEISSSSQVNALNVASDAGHVQVVGLLLDKCPEFSINVKANALNYALQQRQTIMALYLLKRFGKELKKEDKGRALIYASSLGNQDALCVLLAFSSEIALTDKGTALGVAANLDTLKRLLSCFGAEIKDFRGGALEKAAARGDVNIVSYLLREYGTEIDSHHQLNAFKRSIEPESIPLIAFLFAQVDEETFEEGLRRAAIQGKAKIIRVLLDLYEEDDLNDRIRSSFALEEASNRGYTEIVRMLLQNCAKTLPHHTIKHMLSLAIDSSSLAIIEEFLANDSILRAIGWAEHSLLIGAQNLAETHDDGPLYQLIVERLLQVPLFALYHAVKNRKMESLSSLLHLHTDEISQADKNKAVRVAVGNNDMEMLRLLLSHLASNMLARDRINLLEEATIAGNIDLLNVLLEDASFLNEAATNYPTLMYRAQMTQLREENPGLQLVIERLDQVEMNSVANRNTQSMTQRAQNTENSMQALSKNQIVLVNALKKHYEAVYQDKSWDVILIEIKSYLEAEYAKSPAKDIHGESLPLHYTEGLTSEQLKAYYQHRIHTAWRYLSIPNPWISEYSHAILLENETRYANIFDDDKELICYLWLAISDETVLLEEGFTVEGNKYVFAQNLGYLGRAHNYDKSRPALDENKNPKLDEKGEIILEHYDDLEADKPTCEMGVTQRLLEAVYGHPYIQDPIARPLSSLIIFKHMIQKLITNKEKATDSDNLLDRLSVLPLTILKAIHFEIGILLSLYEGESELVLSETENQSKISALTIPEHQLKCFIEDLKLFFMPERINAKTLVKHNAFKELEFKGYIPFIRHCAQNPLIAFSEQIYNFLKAKVRSQLVEAKNTTFTPAFNASSEKREPCEEFSDNNLQSEVKEAEDKLGLGK